MASVQDINHRKELGLGDGQPKANTPMILDFLLLEQFCVKRGLVKRKWTPYGQSLVFSSSTLLSQGSFFIKPSSSCHSQTPKILQPTDINKITSHYIHLQQNCQNFANILFLKFVKSFIYRSCKSPLDLTNSFSLKSKEMFVKESSFLFNRTNPAQCRR